MREQDPVLGSAEALAAFMQGFFEGTLPVAGWHHREHIIMAGWHLLRYSEPDTLERVRVEIKEYNVAQGGQNTETSGYHETLTRFWLRMTGEALARHEGLGELERISAVADDLGARTRLFQDYYSFDVVKSTEARMGWVEPDRKPLPPEAKLVA